MDFEFDPAFPLLMKFEIGLPPTRISEDDVLAVSKYLGVDLPDASLSDQIGMLSKELDRQNRFMTTALSSDAIFDSEDYLKSTFVKEIVANNRTRLRNRLTRS